MRTSALTFTTFLGLLAPAAMADFDIYFTRGVSQQPFVQIFQQEVTNDDCDIIARDMSLSFYDDISSKAGFRCKGRDNKFPCTAEGNLEDLEELELHFYKAAHFTLYENRNWGIFDTDDNKVGQCVMAEGYDHHSVKCGSGQGNERYDRLAKKAFFCKSDTLDAESVWE